MKIRLVDNLNFKQKVERSILLIEDAWKKYSDRLVVAHSLGKDSAVVWHLAKKISKHIKGFIITTRFKPKETINFMEFQKDKFPELNIFSNDEDIPSQLYLQDPDKCCHLLKVKPMRMAIKSMNVFCLVTGLRSTEGRTRIDFKETEKQGEDYVKLNPILLWTEAEVWKYIAINRIDVNPLYGEGYRSLGCDPCTAITPGEERAGRWLGSSKCGGECGIHTKPLWECDGKQ